MNGCFECLSCWEMWSIQSDYFDLIYYSCWLLVNWVFEKYTWLVHIITISIVRAILYFLMIMMNINSYLVIQYLQIYLSYLDQPFSMNYIFQCFNWSSYLAIYSRYTADIMVMPYSYYWKHWNFSAHIEINYCWELVDFKVFVSFLVF